MRKFKKMGLVALATLALSGLWVASASAQQLVFEAGSYPAKVTGTQEGIATLFSPKGTMECNTSLSGEITGPTKVAGLSLSGYCESFGIKNTFKMNGCNAELTPGWNAFGFGGSGCGPITIGGGFCTLTIPSQDGLYATYENTGSGVKVSLESNRLRYSGCGEADNESGSFKATWNLSGVSLGAPFEESLFAAEKYPTTLTGAQSGGFNKFQMEAGDVECNKVTYAGSLSAAGNTMTLTPSFAECAAFGFLSATVTTNGCQFVYHLEEEGEGENYPFDITCPAGKSITITASTCAVSVSAQSGLKAVNYQLTGPSPTARGKVTVLHSITGLTYTVTKDGFACKFAGLGTRNTGGYSGNAQVEGQNAEGRPRNIKIGA